MERLSHEDKGTFPAPPECIHCGSIGTGPTWSRECPARLRKALDEARARVFLFSGAIYDPEGGSDDLDGVFPSLEAAMEYLPETASQWWSIMDSEGRNVASGYLVTTRPKHWFVMPGRSWGEVATFHYRRSNRFARQEPPRRPSTIYPGEVALAALPEGVGEVLDGG